MGRILAISSQVVRGHVGLSAIVPALQRLGHDVLPLPTIVLSNHPGHLRAAGTRIEVNTLASMVEVLDANGWLSEIDAVITGYIPTPEHAGCIARAIDLVRDRSPKCFVVVDPVMGDDPRGLYVEADTAVTIRDMLVPRADLITPNRFEVSWLTGIEVATVTDVAKAAVRFGPRMQVIATSVPDGVGLIANVHARDGRLEACTVDKLARVPHGTGDLLTGLYIGHRLAGADNALGRAAAGVRRAIANSAGRNDLLLAIATPESDWTRETALPVDERTT